jgi:Na+-translocating ferredoxin:NAD+ oxidoreductase subunit C
MLSKSFFGYAKPAFHYELLSTTLPQPIPVPATDGVTLLLPQQMGIKASEIIKVGASVKTGQRLAWDNQPGPSVVSTVTGTIQKVEAYIGDYNQKFTAITVAPEGEETLDDQFAASAGDLTPQALHDFLSSAPGAGPYSKLLDENKPIDTIIIYGGDTDLLVETNLYILKSETQAVEQGIKALKAATGIEKVVLAVPAESFQNVDGHFPADVRAVPSAYPGAQPLMILHHMTGKMLDQGQRFEDLGMLFIRAEAVASIGKAVQSGRIPTDKILTVVDQNGNRHLVSAKLGTPVGNVLKTLNIKVKDGDRIIFGGPMTGTAIYSETQPIAPDSDAIMVQSHADIVFSSDYPCINCGECTRICPSNIQVHMLERFLEANQYQDGADQYDLYSCVECGLCSLVCPSRIPILQYIKLAKFELASAIPAEEENE